MKKRIWCLCTVLALVLSFTLSGCNSRKITIGSKDYSENIVLGEMLAQLIETHTDIKVDRKLNMGGTFVCFQALKKGQIDMYPEYTGTALTAQLKMDVINDPDEAYRVVAEEFDKQFNIKWLKPYGYNNTYAIAVTKKAAETYNLNTCSDLAAVSGNLIFGAEHEFFNREDGFDGFSNTYGITFKGEPKKMNVSLKYQAIGNGDMDVTDAFSTDGEIKEYDLKVLEDDKGYFPPYYPSTVVKKETLEKYPELEDILNKMASQISEEEMMDLNYKVNVEKKDAKATATEFLKSKNMLD